MTDLTLLSSKSPFDSIRQVRPDGSEFWSARDLMSVMGYGAWREFRVPIDRAMKSAANQGHDVSSNFGGSTKISSTKPEVAAAQSYFAIRTREAEVSPKPALEGEEVQAWGKKIHGIRILQVQSSSLITWPDEEGKS